MEKWARSKDRLQGGAVRTRRRFLVAGLQPTESVVLNGKSDLSSCMVANDNGAILEFVLTKCQEHMSTNSALTPKGQKASSSGSMYLYFTDHSGDRYLLTVFDHTRKTYTLKYNSLVPAIMKIEWNNKQSIRINRAASSHLMGRTIWIIFIESMAGVLRL